MSDRNRLSAGDYLVPLPIGFPMCLKYDENGVLVQICKGYEWNNKKEYDVSSTFLYSLINDHKVPNKIALRRGTTYVSGILYSVETFKGCGILPQCKFDDIIARFKVSTETFMFYAISVKSLSAVFRGAVPIRQWLTFSKFNVPQGFLLDPKTAGDVDTYIVHHGQDSIWNSINFKSLQTPEFAVFSSEGVEYGSFNLFENIVKSTKKYTLDSGTIDCKVTFEGSRDPMSVPYAEVVKYNIKKNTTLLYDKNFNILYSKSNSKNPVENTLMCPVCGKIIHVPKFGVTTCSDPNCNSRLYPRVKQFLVDLQLPYISYTRYEEICQERGLDFHVPDILDIEEFEDTKLKCTVFETFRAITPKFVASDDNVLLQFCNTCKNASGTIQYYLQHPDDIQIDISSDIERSIRPVVEWYSNADNIKDLISVFHNDKIELISENVEFYGAPIFRNKNIVITGKFIHGDTEYIASILRGYNATVQKEVTPDTSCIVVGDMLENISGHIIKKGHEYNIPIINETEFFNSYDIEFDIAENL